MQANNDHKNWLKLPNYLDLGVILPGQYGEACVSFNAPHALFLTLNLTQRAIKNGFFLLQDGGNDCFQQMNVVVKQNKEKKILVGSYSQEVSSSKVFHGQLIITENQLAHKIKLSFQVQIPRIKCLKMMKDISTNFNLMKLIVNKAVTSDVRISLFNEQPYPLTLQAGLLNKTSISDKLNPFILKPHAGSIKAEPKQQFLIFMNIQTNIGFGSDPKGLKKVIFRNVLTLKTNSVIIWCLPLEITVVYVKQPEIKE